MFSTSCHEMGLIFICFLILYFRARLHLRILFPSNTNTNNALYTQCTLYICTSVQCTHCILFICYVRFGHYFAPDLLWIFFLEENPATKSIYFVAINSVWWKWKLKILVMHIIHSFILSIFFFVDYYSSASHCSPAHVENSSWCQVGGARQKQKRLVSFLNGYETSG